VTITVLYSCRWCGLTKVSADVPSRLEEHVEVWMRQTAEYVMRDHIKRSPNCAAPVISELMIPMPSHDARVGDLPLN
jgi:hypothetical protein